MPMSRMPDAPPCSASCSSWAASYNKCKTAASLFRGDGDLDAVERLGADDLAGETRVGFDRERHVEHVDFRIRRRRKLLVPAVIHINVARRAGTGAATFGGDRKTCIAQHFHHAPAVAAFDDMLRAFRSEERRVGKECRSRW